MCRINTCTDWKIIIMYLDTYVHVSLGCFKVVLLKSDGDSGQLCYSACMQCVGNLLTESIVESSLNASAV